MYKVVHLKAITVKVEWKPCSLKIVIESSLFEILSKIVFCNFLILAFIKTPKVSVNMAVKSTL